MSTGDITRFTRSMDGSMEPCEDGEWVRYEDHVQEVEAPASAVHNAAPVNKDPASRMRQRRSRVASMLAVVVAQSGMSRSLVAEKAGMKLRQLLRALDWEPDLTLDTISRICFACGWDFDVIARPEGERRMLQRWEQPQKHKASDDSEADLYAPPSAARSPSTVAANRATPDEVAIDPRTEFLQQSQALVDEVKQSIADRRERLGLPEQQDSDEHCIVDMTQDEFYLAARGGIKCTQCGKCKLDWGLYNDEEFKRELSPGCKSTPEVGSQQLQGADGIKPRPLSYSLDDYYDAPGLTGPLAYTWQDKPHRLVYDLLAALKFYTNKRE